MVTETKEKAGIGAGDIVASTAVGAATAGTAYVGLKEFKKQWVDNNHKAISEAAEAIIKKKYNLTIGDIKNIAVAESLVDNNDGKWQALRQEAEEALSKAYKKITEDAKNIGTKEKIAIGLATVAAIGLTMVGLDQFKKHQANQAHAHETTEQNTNIDPKNDNIASASQGVESQKQTTHGRG